jgi:sensor histidine kinase YesM
MIIQPHVENALLHGILPKSGSGHIDIQFLKTERHVCIRISDNGVGAQSLKQHKTHNSLATETINQILTLNTKINGKLQRVTRRFLGAQQNEGTQIEILLEL